MSALVFTDLDGTLLDHQSYSFLAAEPGLNLLRESSIAVIPVSSKTRAEVEPLLAELGLDVPFIIENGAAVFIPMTLCSDRESALPIIDSYRVKAFAPSVTEWAETLAQLHELLPEAFVAFSRMPVAQVMELTGLSADSAGLAQQREFSDPLYWTGTDDDFDVLKSVCKKRQIDVVRGGRFVHLLKGSDKGRAVKWLSQWYESNGNQVPKTVALGDGENDLSMLNVVDYPVQVKPHQGGYPEFTHPELIRTELTGPAGWSEAIAQLLPRLI